MSKFNVLLDTNSIASQIAWLLNTYNNLRTTHTYLSILSSSATYSIIQGAYTNGIGVAGCVAVKRKNNNYSLIQHLCVHEYHRRKGYAQQLVMNAVNSCSTRYVYATIRENNTPSVTLAQKMGFQTFKREKVNDYYLLTVEKQIRP